MDKIKFGSHADQNSAYRSYMEDKILIKEEKNYFFFSIFDGHGGDFVANQLQEKFLYILNKNIGEGQVQPDKINKQLENTFIEADGLFEKDYKGFECGSTAIVGLIFPDPKTKILLLSIANIGDSSGFIFDKNNGYRLAFEHKASDNTEKDRIEQIEQKGKIFVGRVEGILAVTRAFGDFTLKKSGVNCIPFQWPQPIELKKQYEFIVIGSDGIWDVFNDKIELMKDYLYQQAGNNCTDIAKFLLEEAKQLGSRDNLSIIVVKIEK